jgi:hypothetical protein
MAPRSSAGTTPDGRRRRQAHGRTPRARVQAGWLAAPSVAVALLLLGSCRAKKGEDIAAPVITAPFVDTFERAELGPAWRDTGGNYGIASGKLRARNAYNHPAWLHKRLPTDVMLELDVQSNSDAGDIKVELFGDGVSFDPDRGGYVSTGYVFIFGGWHNALSVICRNNEHDEGRKVMRADRRVEVGRTYHFLITRKAGRIDWLIDGQPFLAWTDPQPLVGAGHEYFAINDWEAEVSFDNLAVRPAP